MGIKMNFSDVGTFKALPDGAYPGVIFSIEQLKGATSKEPYLKFTVELDEDKDRGVKKAQRAWTNFSLQPQSLWKLKQLLIRMGWDEDELEDDFDLEPADLVGREVVAVLAPPDPGYNINKVVDLLNPDDAEEVAATSKAYAGAGKGKGGAGTGKKGKF